MGEKIANEVENCKTWKDMFDVMIKNGVSDEVFGNVLAIAAVVMNSQFSLLHQQQMQQNSSMDGQGLDVLTEMDMQNRIDGFWQDAEEKDKEDGKEKAKKQTENKEDRNN